MKKEEITRYVPEEKVLLTDIRRLIEETRSGIAVTVNAGLTILYWRIGKRIKEEVLKNKRAEYGKEIVATLSQQLTGDYGKGYTRSNLVRMVQFAEYFQEQKIIVTRSRQLSWTNFLALIPLKKPLQREFY
ncbi:cytoplasmic protein, partial [Candidatus Woesearchaeota archaeon]|nr:cytoplasmic protein [Candidatus Woesearchaeota archaeon]